MWKRQFYINSTKWFKQLIFLSFRFVKVGCDRTVISKDKDDESNKKANEYKEMGNDAFRQAQYKQAMEYYTSALMIKDDNHILYTNRAQALIKLGNITKFQPLLTFMHI